MMPWMKVDGAGASLGLLTTSVVTCFKWFLSMVPSGSGSGGICSGSPDVGVSRLESRSTSQMSSGSLQLEEGELKSLD